MSATLQPAPSLFEDSGKSRNLRVLGSLLGPVYRGLLLKRGRQGSAMALPTAHDVAFTWSYTRDQPEFAKLSAAARKGQWDADTLPWGTAVDLRDPTHPPFRPGTSPLEDMPGFSALSTAEQADQRGWIMAWMLSQFLHGEQGALYVACQLTEAVSWTEGKLYGATQVMDEGRHVDVFDRYLATKLERRYTINDNLYVMLDALMSDRRWDIKFLGMQILVEGLALGAFGVLRQSTGEPLLAELLRMVITDEARHVHFGVIALQRAVETMSESERQEREDWAYEMCVVMRNRFLGHEFYEEHWAHRLSRAAWDRALLDSDYMKRFRENLFKRVIPNLKRIGLLSDRVRRHYEALGLLHWESGRAAPDLAAEDLLA